MILPSGENLAKALSHLRDGDTVTLDHKGSYVGGIVSGVRHPISIAGNNAHIAGDAGLHFDQCGAVRIENLISQKKTHAGLFFTRCESLIVLGCECNENGASGILTGNTSNVRIAACGCRQNKQHGVYLSQSGDNLRVENCVLRQNGKAAVQVNAVEGPHSGDPDEDWISVLVQIIGNHCERNQLYGHGAAINLAGCRKAQVIGNIFHEHQGRSFIALFDDETGKAKYAVHDCDIINNGGTFAAGFGHSCVSHTRTCSDINVRPSNRWPAGVTVEETV